MKKAHLRDRVIVDLAMLNALNSEGCPACGRGFTLGEPAISARGPWGNRPRVIHEQEAVYDPRSRCYYEGDYFRSTIQPRN